MSKPIEEKKISQNTINTYGVVAAPDKLNGTAAQNKAVFDRLIRDAVSQLYNGLIDALVASTGASNIGSSTEGLEATDLQSSLDELKENIDEKTDVSVSYDGTSRDYIRFITVDGEEKRIVGDAQGAGDSLTFGEDDDIVVIAGSSVPVEANPTLAGTEDELDSILIDTTKYALPRDKVISLSLASTSWVLDGSNYKQTVTVTGSTANTMVEIQLTPTQIASLKSDGVNQLIVENDNGTIKVWAIGGQPSSNLTVQATRREVRV